MWHDLVEDARSRGVITKMSTKDLGMDGGSARHRRHEMSSAYDEEKGSKTTKRQRQEHGQGALPSRSNGQASYRHRQPTAGAASTSRQSSRSGVSERERSHRSSEPAKRKRAPVELQRSAPASAQTGAASGKHASKRVRQKGPRSRPSDKQPSASTPSFLSSVLKDMQAGPSRDKR